ncbi:S1 family peptidase [Pseudorhodoplanes sp.]|uniref:S1 family peptidase n=1 Tax=Pseudorhodoplanes sp. TaxID=1934341 RepID=UPI003D106229
MERSAVHRVCYHDLDFDRIPVVFRSSRNTPYVREIRVGMPRIPPTVLHSVFYLYENERDARAGENPGGTGFVVSEWPGFYYAVTNWHNAADHDHPVYPVIRLNTKDGGTDVLDLGPEDWEFIPGGDDIAIYPLNIDLSTHQVSAIPTDLFVRESESGYPDIGVGEDTFMVGLFVDHGGITTNLPSVRFGNISMLPDPSALLEQKTGYRGQSYVVDMHSRTGFSGSPVFAYRTFGADLTVDGQHTIEGLTIISNGRPGRAREHGYAISQAQATFRSENIFRFLGIHWGQFPEIWPIKPGKDAFLIRDDHVEGHSGMTCVIPAWKIKAFLDRPKFKGPREEKLKELMQKTDPRRPKPESAKPAGDAEGAPPASDANPNHQEDFKRLLDVAARTRTQED